MSIRETVEAWYEEFCTPAAFPSPAVVHPSQYVKQELDALIDAIEAELNVKNAEAASAKVVSGVKVNKV